MKDPYLYEGTDVLINKLNIKNSEELNRFETDYAILTIDKLKNSDFKLSSLFDILKIHKFIFDDIYDWAGKYRTINIYKKEPILAGKSIDYVFADYIEIALKDLQLEFSSFDWMHTLEKQKIEKICYFVSELWHIHPFREGNTRATVMLLYFLIKKSGLHINIDFISKNNLFFRNALVLSCLYSRSKPEFLFNIVCDSVSIKNFASGKYETIDGNEIKKYSYTNHTMDKLETVRKPKDWDNTKTN